MTASTLGSTSAAPEVSSTKTNVVGVRVSGRVWRHPKKPANRTTMSRGLHKTWDKRLEERSALATMKAREREMKFEAAEKKKQARLVTEARKKAAAEKEHQAHLAKLLSAKQLQRRKRKELRAKSRLKH
ncbi:hypothetical protein IWQ60_008883 [Tieghemiomyces parasiticus]|uniref:rRNA-processing protein n=1 Tax=Tieghemiomyces parasiticus TaxID=78921 RepID=A0A9W7ZR41_9FUNG|nr:hypothetical protein IWQ60_008883 [Tieghemiomyces parasiticus]